MQTRDFNFDFIKNKKYFFTLSLSLITLGLLFNIIFGTNLDIKFTGGTIVKYSYINDVDINDLTNTIQTATEDQIKLTVSKDIIAGSDGIVANNVSIEFPGNKAISLEQQKNLDDTLTSTYPDNNFSKLEASSIDPTNGKNFFLKCLVAVALAATLMIVYVAFRFRKIGGWSAGIMAVIALLHDVIIIYFTFIVMRMSLDDNFIAVVLMILGYSLNDTIIIYDRIRENRRVLGEKTPIEELVNKSINQTLGRTINTSITTAAAIGTVLVVALIFNLQSVISFALPMLIGIISGCYSTICIAGPLWVMYNQYKNNKLQIQKTPYKAKPLKQNTNKNLITNPTTDSNSLQNSSDSDNDLTQKTNSNTSSKTKQSHSKKSKNSRKKSHPKNSSHKSKNHKKSKNK